MNWFVGHRSRKLPSLHRPDFLKVFETNKSNTSSKCAHVFSESRILYHFLGYNFQIYFLNGCIYISGFQVKCCGVDSYADFTGADRWVVNYAAYGYTLKTPLACCKTLPSSTDFTCADTAGATTTNNYLDTVW